MCVSILTKPADIEYIIGDLHKRTAAATGSYIVVPGSFAFTERLYSATDMIHLHIRDSIVVEAADLIGLDQEAPDIKPAIGASDPLIATIGALFNATLMGSTPLCAMQADHLARILAIRLIQNHASPSRPKRRSDNGKIGSRQLEDIDEYINENMQRQIKTDALARIAGISAGHFIRQFKHTTGVTPHQYVIRRRVDRAKYLLSQHSERLATVAMDCGFSSQEHMTYVFGNLVGMTPGAFRRLKRSG